MALATVAALAAGAIAVFLVVAALIHLGSLSAPGRWPAGCCGLACVATLGITISLMPAALAAASASVPYLLSVPTLVSLLAVLADLTHTAVRTTTAAAALLTLAWALFLTASFVFPAPLLAVATLSRNTPSQESPEHPEPGLGEAALSDLWDGTPWELGPFGGRLAPGVDQFRRKASPS